MKIKLLFFSVLLFFGTFCNAQNNGETISLNPSLQDYVPLSPDVAAINKFGNIPVGEATGIPKINIPIYSYNNASNGLKLNVTLNYHAGGVRVAEIASRVGLSWALNAGGVISRIKRGIYDEHSTYGFIFQNELPGELEGNSPGTINARPFNKIYADVMDSQPDIFNYSFAGKSGRFILGKNNDMLLLNQTNIKILKTMGGADEPAAPDDAISSFTITDENGFKYVFSDVELTRAYTFSINDKFVSAWYLTEIISPKAPNAKITFEYESEYLANYVVSYNRTTYQRIDGTGGKYFNGTINNQDLYSKRLSKINFPNGVYLNFDYHGEDVVNAAGGQALESITVHDGMDTKGYVLQHDHSLNRLTLKKVIPFGGTPNNPRSPYEFEYFASLPPRSTVPDHWGFHNGGTSRRIPREIFRGLGYGNFELPGGDRDTDPTFVKYGSLRKITYPTGGYTIFDMEANRAEDSRLDKEFTITEPGPGYETKSTVAHINEAAYESDVVDIHYTGDPDGITDFEITVEPGPPYCSNCKVIIELHYSLDNFSPIMVEEVLLDMYGNSTIDFSVANLVPNHTYKMKFYTQNLSDNYYSYASVSWKEPNANLTNTTTYRHIQEYVGGLRVKRIRNYDGVSSSPSMTKNYRYVLEDGETSSGTLGVYPQYSHTAYYDNSSSSDGSYNPPLTPPENYVNSSGPNVIVRGSSPLFELATHLGSPVIYGRVEIIQKGLNGSFNGREVKYFTNFKDLPVLVDSYFPYTPVQMDKWQYGLLKKHQVFNANNELQKEVINEYRFIQDLYFQDATRFENFKGVSIAPVKFFTGSYIPRTLELPPLGTPVYFLSEDFYPSAGRADIKSVIEHNYYMNETVTVKKEYTYDPLFHKVKSISTTRSDEKKVTKNIEYAFEFLDNDFDNIYGSLFLNNELNAVINEETVLTDLNGNNPITLLSFHVDYKHIGGSVIKPASISTKKGSENLEERILYSRYDNAGNPVELSKKDGPEIVYIWGYDKEFPIAKIENATYSEVANELEISVGNLDLYDEDNLAGINALRGGLSKAQVTTYTYEPLVGVRSITDPKGQTITYHYDTFNRLEFVKDEAGNILKEHQYHYKELPNP